MDGCLDQGWKPANGVASHPSLFFRRIYITAAVLWSPLSAIALSFPQ